MVPPSIRTPEEEGHFPTPSLHFSKRDLLTLFVAIDHSRHVDPVTTAEVWNFTSKINFHCHQFLWTCLTWNPYCKKRFTRFCRRWYRISDFFYLVLSPSLSVLYQHTIVPHFKMETNRSINSFRYVRSIWHSYFTTSSWYLLEKTKYALFQKSD